MGLQPGAGNLGSRHSPRPDEGKAGAGPAGAQDEGGMCVCEGAMEDGELKVSPWKASKLLNYTKVSHGGMEN